MNKKTFKTTVIAVLSLLFSMSAVNASAASSFNDIKDHWAEKTIVKWQDKGIVSGYPDGTFKPDNSVTRAELAKILTNAFNLEKTNDNKLIENPYSDVDVNEWYWKYIQCADMYMPIYKLPVSYETNVPYAENEELDKNGFLPNVDALRMHVAESLVELKKERDNIKITLPDINTIKESLNKTFKDGDYQELFVNHGSVPLNVRRMFEYTWLANELGIMKGDAEGYFLPYSKVTRAELLTMLDRVVE